MTDKPKKDNMMYAKSLLKSEESTMGEEPAKVKKLGMCGSCPVGVGFPLCWACVLVAAFAVYLIASRI